MTGPVVPIEVMRTIGYQVRLLTKLDPQLYCGSAYSASDIIAFEELGINAVVNLTKEEYADYNFPDCPVKDYLQLYQDDREEIPREKLTTFLEWMDAREKEGKVVYVHCQMGISRTAAFVIAWRMWQWGARRDSDHKAWWSRFEDALGRARSCIDVHWKLKQSVLEYFAAR